MQTAVERLEMACSHLQMIEKPNKDIINSIGISWVLISIEKEKYNEQNVTS